MKIDPKFYKVHVEKGREGAFLMCVTYNLDSTNDTVAIEYYELVWSFDDPGLSIPSSRQATFQEELRVLHFATSVYQGSRSDERLTIQKKLKDAYGHGVQITLEEIAGK